MRKFVLMMAMLLAAPTFAQTVYKCAQKGKPVSFQSEPCPAGARTVKSVAAIPERYTPPAYRPAARQDVQWDTVVSNNTLSKPDERAARRAGCDSAKANRARTLERVGLRRTYDLLSQLDASVDAACKGL